MCFPLGPCGALQWRSPTSIVPCCIVRSGRRPDRHVLSLSRPAAEIVMILALVVCGLGIVGHAGYLWLPGCWVGMTHFAFPCVPESDSLGQPTRESTRPGQAGFPPPRVAISGHSLACKLDRALDELASLLPNRSLSVLARPVSCICGGGDSRCAGVRAADHFVLDVGTSVHELADLRLPERRWDTCIQFLKFRVAACRRS